MIKVSDYIVRRVADLGIRHVFLLTGGGAMHLNNSFGKERRIQYVCNHHEQACAMAAEAYAKVTGGLAVINVTSGPGGINALNGVFGAWTDSIPMLVLSGQVKRETCLATYRIAGLRQLGEQEADIIAMVKGITKYATLVDDPLSIRYHLERALHLAMTGRRGPCWLDVPVDVQGAMIDETALRPYVPDTPPPVNDEPMIREQCAQMIARLRAASRPVILAGSGVRLAGAENIFDLVIHKLGIPVVPSRSTHDLVPFDDPLFCGRPGIDCDRPGNFTVQNADLLLILGSSLGIRLISYNWTAFARYAYKIQVDIDEAQLSRPMIRPDMPVLCDARVFLEQLERQLDSGCYPLPAHSEWLAWCKERVARYPCVLPRHRQQNRLINPYHFCEVLFDLLADDECVVAGNGSAYQVPLQVAPFRKGQRFIFNNGCMSMGYELPAAIGAALARPGKRVICLAGDGSIQLNIQELQTLAHHKLPVKLFVFNNRGYLSIRITQTAFFGELVGESPGSGVSFPDMVKLASAYGLGAVRIEGPSFGEQIKRVLGSDGPVLADVVINPEQVFEPKLSSRRLEDGSIVSPPPEDMFPFLDRDELARNLLPPL